MNRDLFWLTDEQFSKIAPHLPTDTRGKARVDDRARSSAAPSSNRKPAPCAISATMALRTERVGLENRIARFMRRMIAGLSR
jgi:hypothetical protein